MLCALSAVEQRAIGFDAGFIAAIFSYHNRCDRFLAHFKTRFSDVTSNFKQFHVDACEKFRYFDRF